ncbi:MAG: hypothetical protein IJQ55_04870 [Alphaproteobacteria bacterium]|nr:hypothetical protein [Alphaproteobacteria bacterium]
MKKFLLILPCVIILCSCDKTKFYETGIECLSSDAFTTEYTSLEVKTKTAILKTDSESIVFKLYTQDATEEDPAVYEDMGIYKNETNDLMPQYLHFVDKDHYTVGTSLHGPWYQCRKISK